MNEHSNNAPILGFFGAFLLFIIASLNKKKESKTEDEKKKDKLDVKAAILSGVIGALLMFSLQHLLPAVYVEVIAATFLFIPTSWFMFFLAKDVIFPKNKQQQ